MPVGVGSGGPAGGPATSGTTPASSVTVSAVAPPFPVPPPALPTNVQALASYLAQWNSDIKIPVVLARLGLSGAWYPNDFIGPGGGVSSTPDAYGFAGSGFYRVTKAGVLRSFAMASANTPGSDFTFDMYVGTGDNPASLAYSGQSMTLVAGQYVATLEVDLAVSVGDLICFRSVAPFGYTSSGMEITAQWSPR